MHLHEIDPGAATGDLVLGDHPDAGAKCFSSTTVGLERVPLPDRDHVVERAGDDGGRLPDARGPRPGPRPRPRRTPGGRRRPARGSAGITMPGRAPSTPASQDPSVLTTSPSSYSAVSSPRYQTLPSASWAYQSWVSSLQLAVDEGPVPDHRRPATPKTSRRSSSTSTSMRSSSPSTSPSYTHRVPGSSGRYGLSIDVDEVLRRDVGVVVAAVVDVDDRLRLGPVRGRRCIVVAAGGRGRQGEQGQERERADDLGVVACRTVDRAALNGS